MVTFSVRLLVRQSVQPRMDDKTGEIGLHELKNSYINHQNVIALLSSWKQTRDVFEIERCHKY